jgi:phosphopentomutase
VARVIARPFVGAPGGYTRTYHRQDFATLSGPTALTRWPPPASLVVGIGKIPTSSAAAASPRWSTSGNADARGRRRPTGRRLVTSLEPGRLPPTATGISRRATPWALEALDAALPGLLGRLGPDDLFLLTADLNAAIPPPRVHRPLARVRAAAGPPAGAGGGSLGTRDSLADVGATVAAWLGGEPGGPSVLGDLRP